MGITTIPNNSGTCRGCTRVPRTSPKEAAVPAARGSNVNRSRGRTSRWTGVAGTNIASGNTIAAAIRPWSAPATTFSTATLQTGSGAITRSSISLL